MTGEEYNNQFSEEELKLEVWKAIPDFEGYYEASTLGRIRSVDRDVKLSNGQIRHYKGRIIIPHLSNRGYMLLSLYVKGKEYKFSVHSLVVKTFLGNPEGMEVNHKDENKVNNRLHNLEYVTHQYNLNYGSHNVNMATTLCKRVAKYGLQGTLLGVYNNSKEAAASIGRKPNTSIGSCCRGEIKTAYGYIWKYADEKDESIKKWESWKDSKKIK